MAANKHTPGRRSPKDTICHARTLKVRKSYYSRLIKDKDHPRFDRTVFVTTPWINLQGQWLDQAGFSIHTPVKI
ncbi:MAG: SymE family type I addiction module toxin [Candidatus Thiodiazotropha endolucinida]